MDQLHIEIGIAMGSALAAGGLIGLERSFHGRPAGFRTHALVCLSSALLMVLAVHQLEWFTSAPAGAIRIDPTRMAQGIMTGIGFLGAGVIFKEGVTVRGLTTAASIWITAALGMVYGAGFYYLAMLGTVATLGVLGAFRWLERQIPSQFFAEFSLQLARENPPSEDALRQLLSEYGFEAAAMTYRPRDSGSTFEYQTVIRAFGAKKVRPLATYLLEREDVIEFAIVPTAN